jgi:hypothetical protein
MPYPTREAAENAAFLDALRRTGNSSLAARECGLNRSTLRGRRARNPLFAVQWEAALVAAHAALKLGGGARLPAAGRRPRGAPPGSRLRTLGGEIMVGPTRGGRLQLRRSPPGRMTVQGENFFCRALAASANIRLSAAAAGFTHSAFYQKRKKRPAFAREWGVSLEIGFDRIEWALSDSLAAGLDPQAIPDYGDAPLPPMTISQAIEQVSFHRKAARAENERCRGGRQAGRGEDSAADSAAGSAAARARHYEQTGSWRFAREQRPPPLPPLHRVTGWSKADPAKVHNPDRPFFGGWRIEDMERKRGKG